MSLETFQKCTNELSQNVTETDKIESKVWKVPAPFVLLVISTMLGIGLDIVPRNLKKLVSHAKNSLQLLRSNPLSPFKDLRCYISPIVQGLLFIVFGEKILVHYGNR